MLPTLNGGAPRPFKRRGPSGRPSGSDGTRRAPRPAGPSHDLHPPALQEAGLPQAMRVYCEQFSESTGIPVACEADDNVRDLSRGAALALFRIVQEALGNAAKHGRAKQITVRLTRSADVVSLAVSDDGVGFDSSGLATSGGLGLIMMRERASQLNGKFDFESALGRGTTISVSIPFR